MLDKHKDSSLNLRTIGTAACAYNSSGGKAETGCLWDIFFIGDRCERAQVTVGGTTHESGSPRCYKKD